MKWRDLHTHLKALKKRESINTRVVSHMRNAWRQAHMQPRSAAVNKALVQFSAASFLPYILNPLKNESIKAEREFTEFQKKMRLFLNIMRAIFDIFYAICGLLAWYCLLIFFGKTIDFLSSYPPPILEEPGFYWKINNAIITFSNNNADFIVWSFFIISIFSIIAQVMKIRPNLWLLTGMINNVILIVFLFLYTENGGTFFKIIQDNWMLILYAAVQYCTLILVLRCLCKIIKKDETEERILISHLQEIIVCIQQSLLKTLKKLWDSLLRLQARLIDKPLACFLHYGFRASSISGIAAASEQHGLSLLSATLATIAPPLAPVKARGKTITGNRGGRHYAAA